MDAILDAADRLLARAGEVAVSLPAIAAEAGAPASSLYHFFPSLEAVLAALLQRYNALEDGLLEEALAAAPPFARWQDIAEAMLAGARAFHDAHPAYAELMRRTSAYPALRRIDDAHMAALGARMARDLETTFALPPQPLLAERLGLAAAIADRTWAFLPDIDGKISDFAFEESRRAVIAYLSSYLPPYLSPKEPHT